MGLWSARSHIELVPRLVPQRGGLTVPQFLIRPESEFPGSFDSPLGRRQGKSLGCQPPQGSDGLCLRCAVRWRSFRALTVLDAFTREALAIEVDQGVIKGEQVVDVMTRLALIRRAPRTGVEPAHLGAPVAFLPKLHSAARDSGADCHHSADIGAGDACWR